MNDTKPTDAKPTDPNPHPVLAWKNPREIPKPQPDHPEPNAPGEPQELPRAFRLFLCAFVGAFLLCALGALLDR